MKESECRDFCETTTTTTTFQWLKLTSNCSFKCKKLLKLTLGMKRDTMLPLSILKRLIMKRI